ncbi:hypothetical protein GALMADRAFT_138894 [Galerina marginata CBS 339.88]|uniref:Uncharacterized protein n=1 Tax=Galerina marginata (strain CBS 339.88) TaxID=685588 RepID=A0A067T3U4_GALM3|nr:hypothetical protein GALMADRAFT_138894 [Galerina marginata CBS 339.88]
MNKVRLTRFQTFYRPRIGVPTSKSPQRMHSGALCDTNDAKTERISVPAREMTEKQGDHHTSGEEEGRYQAVTKPLLGKCSVRYRSVHRHFLCLPALHFHAEHQQPQRSDVASTPPPKSAPTPIAPKPAPIHPPNPTAGIGIFNEEK